MSSPTFQFQPADNLISEIHFLFDLLLKYWDRLYIYSSRIYYLGHLSSFIKLLEKKKLADRRN